MKPLPLLLISAFALLISCTSDSPKETPSASHEPPAVEATAATEVEVFSNDTSRMRHAGGYGYLIRVDGQVYIYQPTIPAISGNRGFATAEEAKRAGELVAYKIRNNIMPPAVSVAELDSLGISK